MSWFSRSIAGTLNLGDDDDTDTDKHLQQVDSSSPPSSPGRGVKEDLSELTKTLSRQFWGVASFLAPPPPPEHSQISQSKSHDASDPEFTGIRGDLAEIGGRFRSGISKLSTNIAVSEISKIASNFLQLGSEDHDYDSVRGAVGVTDEVVAFVRDIAMHPETWLDFPLPEPDDEDHQDFDMSDAQQEHALAVERLAPRLAALRIELCPGYMSEDCFWKIYFVLLHPRLSRQDAELLSTPQIVKARSSLTLELQNRNKVKPAENWSQEGPSYSKDVTTFPHEEGLSVPSIPQSESIPLETSASKSDRSAVAADYETDKHPVVSTEIQIIDKSVIKEGLVNMSKDQNFHPGSSKFSEVKDEDDGDDWLKEENSEIVGASGTTISMENEEDVSFSDLEEDDGDIPTSYKKETYSSDSSAKDSRDWVQLSRSSPDSAKDINSVTIERVGSEQVSAHSTETKESNDWLDLEDIDVA